VLATRDRVNALFEAVVAVGANLDLEVALRGIVESALTLVDARYGAMGVIGDGERLAEFIPVGLTEAEIEGIHHWPEGRGLLGALITNPKPLRIADLSQHELSSGFPAGHPPMTSFLGVPIRIRDEVYGNLYLTEKRGGGQFDEEDEAVLVALAAAAGVAIDNARLYDEARRQQRWLSASAAAVKPTRCRCLSTPPTRIGLTASSLPKYNSNNSSRSLRLSLRLHVRPPAHCLRVRHSALPCRLRCHRSLCLLAADSPLRSCLLSSRLLWL